MTPLAKAHKVLKGDLSNAYYGGYDGYLYWDESDKNYIAYVGITSDPALTYISTVGDFINFKGDDMETVYTQEMVDNNKLPEAGMKCITSTGVHTIKYIGKKVVVSETDDGEEFMSSIKSALHSFKPLTPPIELISGKAYQFDIGKKTRLGFFKGSGFSGGIRSYWELSACNNIQPLTVEGNNAHNKI